MNQEPGSDVIYAIETGFSQITRRVAVYEQDGVTPWNPDPLGDPNFERLVDGNITVDSGRDERRGLDITLRNDDMLLRPSQDNGLWYDKIIKVWRGIRFQPSAAAPLVQIIEGSYAAQLAAAISGFGYTRTEIKTTGTSYNDYIDGEILISAPGFTGVSDKFAILQQAFAAGKSILTFGTNNTGVQVPFITTVSNAATNVSWGVTPPTADDPLPVVFSSQNNGLNKPGNRPTAIAAGAIVVASWTNAGPVNFYTGIVYTNAAGGRWLDLHLPTADAAQVLLLLQGGMRWLQRYEPIKEEEWQLGEFTIDRISDQNFPYHVKLTGRDLTKRPLNSKFTKLTAYSDQDDAYDTVYSLAINAGIPASKIRLPNIQRSLGKTRSYEVETPRWTPMKEIYNSFGYEIFFTADGFLVAEPFADPITSPVSRIFQTGPAGNLVTIERSVNDSNLYNHLAVYSENPTTGIPYFGEAINTDATSPTNVNEIGDRFVKLDMNFLTSDAECSQRASELLKTYALESYEMNLSSLYYPWLDAGDIVQVLDPNRFDFEPTKYLMSNLTLPLALGPMTSSTRRVTYVGESNE